MNLNLKRNQKQQLSILGAILGALSASMYFLPLWEADLWVSDLKLSGLTMTMGRKIEYLGYVERMPGQPIFILLLILPLIAAVCIFLAAGTKAVSIGAIAFSVIQLLVVAYCGSQMEDGYGIISATLWLKLMCMLSVAVIVISVLLLVSGKGAAAGTAAARTADDTAASERKSCPNCGNRIPAGSKFCNSCGAKIDAIEPEVRLEEGKIEEVGIEKENKLSSNINRALGAGKAALENLPRPKPDKKLIGTAGGALALLFLAITLVVMHKPTVDLEKYVTISAMGYDGYGTASYQIDHVKLVKDWEKKLKYNKKNPPDRYVMAAYPSAAHYLSDHIGFSFKTSAVDLHNGDELELGVNETLARELEEQLNCKIKADDITYKVSDLKPVGHFDPFEELPVSFSGIAPEGEMILDVENDQLPDRIRVLGRKTEPENENLKNGDEITLILEMPNINAYIQEYGMVPEPLTKTYTVEGLDYYAESAGQISEDTLEAMKQQTEDAYKTSAARNYKDRDHLNSIKYIGNYFLTAKKGTNLSDRNVMVLVYKINASIYDKENKSSIGDYEFYYHSEFHNLINSKDGKTAVDLNDYSTSSGTVSITYPDGTNIWWSPVQLTSNGFPDLDTLKNKLVTSRLETYTVEDNITDTSAPVYVEMQNNETAVEEGGEDDAAITEEAVQPQETETSASAMEPPSSSAGSSAQMNATSLVRQSSYSSSSIESVVGTIRAMYQKTNDGSYTSDGTRTFGSDGRLILLKASTGDPVLDAVMKKVGYSSYSLEFYYDNKDVSAEQVSPGPNFMYGVIDGIEYRYYYHNNAMIRRIGPEGTQNNPETNEYMNSLYLYAANAVQ